MRLVPATGALLWAGRLPAAERLVPPLSAERRRSLLAALAAEEKNYDMAEQMVRRPMRGPGYHSTLKSGIVHPTRDSLTYAAALLDSGLPQHLDRAEAILKRVIGLQDQNPQSKTYGIWSWYYEEPLERMSPPDWNWADFCGVQLLSAWIGHRQRLEPRIAAQVGEAIQHAARSIRKRNVGPGYTNIAIMGTYVTLVAAEQFQDADLGVYAKERLRRLHRAVLDQGSFSEYNSPTYSIVALSELSRLLLHLRDAEDRRLVRELHDLAWRHVATHFHSPTRQWAGPNSRSYGDDLRRNSATLAFLEAACGGQAGLITQDPLPLGLDAYRLPLECPSNLVPFFRELKAPRAVVETFIPAEPARAGAKNPVVGTTWLHPLCALGTVNRGDFWNQRRPLLAHWGTPARPVILRARFLKDGTDFCSALIFSAQHEGFVLSTVTFATDYGDFHPSLDRVKDATIKASDLRLRFELTGEPDEVGIGLPMAPAPALISDRRVCLRLYRLEGTFGGKPIHWEQSREFATVSLDAVFHAGEETTFNLAALDRAFLAFALHLGPIEQPEPAEAPQAVVRQDRCASSWRVPGWTLRVEVSVKPGPLAVANDSALTACVSD